MATVVSGSSAYCTPAQFLERYDVRTVGDLLSDESERLNETQVKTSTKLTTLLRQASGKIEMATSVGGRYKPADLLLLNGTNMGEQLAGLVAALTFGVLLRRRPDPNRETPPEVEEADEILNELCAGTMIFGFQENIDAGHLDHKVETAQDVDARDLPTTQAKRLFGTRGNRRGNR